MYKTYWFISPHAKAIHASYARCLLVMLIVVDPTFSPLGPIAPNMICGDRKLEVRSLDLAFRSSVAVCSLNVVAPPTRSCFYIRSCSARDVEFVPVSRILAKYFNVCACNGTCYSGEVKFKMTSVLQTNCYPSTGLPCCMHRNICSVLWKSDSPKDAEYDIAV